MKIGVFIFTRDLRLNDNTGLINLAKLVDKIIPVFIFTEKQIGNENKYRSVRQISFMRDCLIELNKMLELKKSKLFTFYGSYAEVLEIILKKINSISVVNINKDYTPYAIERSNEISRICKKYDVIFNEVEDYLLVSPLNPVSKTNNGKPYSKFTPFFNSVKNTYTTPEENNFNKYIKAIPSIKYEVSINEMLSAFPTSIKVNGGRINAIKMINSRENTYSEYNKNRNMLSYLTSGLSPYIKFGCLSIRKVMHYFRAILKKNNDLIKQLYWREFYYHVAINNQRVLTKKGTQNYNNKYDKVKWNTSEKNIKNNYFNSWKKGTTGIPLVDAAMRELNETGIMHNRCRLVVASFLTKNLFWDWKDGEKYFATKLIDYDPIVNNGNWQWCSGSGVDAQMYFRVFNPFLQSKKYDPIAEYIKKWIPELKDVPSNNIHKWNIYYKKYENLYYKPIIDVNESAKKAVKLLKKYLY